MARKEKVMEAGDAVSKFVKDGCLLAVGGMHMHNNAMAVIREIVRQKKSIGSLTTSPSACTNADMLIGAGLVGEIYCSYVGFEHLGLAPNFRKSAQSGDLKVRECDEAFSVYSLRGGASSLPFHPLPKGLEATSVPKLNPDDYKFTKDPFTGEDVMCVRSLQPDVAVIHCQKADAYGNAIFEGSKFTDFDMIKASDKVIIQVEEVVPTEYILEKTHKVNVPGLLVDAVINVPFGCHPTASHRYYTYDEDHLKEYLKACKEDFSAYLDKYVYGPKTNEDYLEVIGGREKATKLMERDIPW
ncbi:MAG: CoA transferase subunit A [Methanomassiliicoccales archaeon]|nr:MAG: CoA transferase subunit A [Methanomassiliicoccales archaeon]